MEHPGRGEWSGLWRDLPHWRFGRAWHSDDGRCLEHARRRYFSVALDTEPAPGPGTRERETASTPLGRRKAVACRSLLLGVLPSCFGGRLVPLPLALCHGPFDGFCADA